MTIEIVTLVLSITALIFSGTTVIFSIISFGKVIGLENSTHKIQYVPVEEPDFSSVGSTTNVKEESEDFDGGVDKELIKGFNEHLYPDINADHI